MLLSPFEALDAKTLAEQQWDADVAKNRAARAAAPLMPGIDPAQQAYFNTVNDSAQDAATGRAGYNRQWVPLLQSLKGKRFVGGGGLPTERYADLDHTGHLSLVPQDENTATPTVTMPQVTMPQATPTSIGVLKKRAAKTTDAPTAEDQDALFARLTQGDPAWYHQSSLDTLKQKAALPRRPVDAFMRPTPAPAPTDDQAAQLAWLRARAQS